MHNNVTLKYTHDTIYKSIKKTSELYPNHYAYVFMGKKHFIKISSIILFSIPKL